MPYTLEYNEKPVVKTPTANISINGLQSWIGDPSNQTVGLEAFTSSMGHGKYNTAFGTFTLKVLKDGDYNVGIGYNVLNNVTDHSYNIGIGTNISIVGFITNIVAVGHGVEVDQSNTIKFGSADHPYERLLVHTPGGVVDVLQTAVSSSNVLTSNNGSIVVTPISGGYDIAVAVAPTPLSITSFTGGGTYEIGTTINSVVLNWAYNYAPDTSQSINNSIGSLSLPLRTYTYTTPFTSAKTFTLSAVDSARGSASANTSVSFLNRRYWGVTTAAIMTSADITAGSSELSSVISKNISYDCTGGRYFFYAFPASFGNLSTINTKVNNLSFSDWSDNAGGSTTSGFQLSVTNGSGYTATYNVYRSFNLQNGSYIPTEMR